MVSGAHIDFYEILINKEINDFCFQGIWETEGSVTTMQFINLPRGRR